MPIYFTGISVSMRNSSIEHEAHRRSRGVRVAARTLRDVLMAYAATRSGDALECSHPPNGFRVSWPVVEGQLIDVPFGEKMQDPGEAFGSAFVYRDGQLVDCIDFDSVLLDDDEVDIEFRAC